MKIIWFSLLLCYSCSSLAKEAPVELRIAVAANFRTTMEALISDYKTKFSGDFRISSASTGVLYAQIKQGAPFDVFFSADTKTPQKLAQELNLTSPFTYASGILVFWCPNGSPENISALRHWQGRYAMANPKLAPYGVAAQEVITHLNWSKHQHAIMGNNVSQVAQFIQTQNVSCGFIAKSLVPAKTADNEILLLSNTNYKPIDQQALLLPHASKHESTQKLALHFLNYIKHEASQRISQSGYALPELTQSVSFHTPSQVIHKEG